MSGLDHVTSEGKEGGDSFPNFFRFVRPIHRLPFYAREHFRAGGLKLTVQVDDAF